MRDAMAVGAERCQIAFRVHRSRAFEFRERRKMVYVDEVPCDLAVNLLEIDLTHPAVEAVDRDRRGTIAGTSFIPEVDGELRVAFHVRFELSGILLHERQ